MVSLGSLTMKNFRSHRNSTVTFPRSGKTLIRGFNRDTGGSSYAGKSTLGLAIAYVLDIGMPFAAKDQKSWFPDWGPMSVQLSLVADSGEHLVRRSATQYVLTYPDGKSVSGADAVRDGLQKLFGAPTSMLGPLVYKPQGKSGRFLWMTPGDKRDFLAKVVELEQLEVVAAQAQKMVPGMEVELQSCKFKLKSAEDRVRDLRGRLDVELVDEEQAVKELEKVEAELAAAQQSTEDEEEEDYTAAAEQRQRLTVAAEAPFEKSLADLRLQSQHLEDGTQLNPLKEALQAAERRLNALRVEDGVAATAVSVARQQLGANVARDRAKLERLPRVKAEAQELREKLAALEATTCPTCGRPVSKEASILMTSQARDSLAKLADEQQGLEAIWSHIGSDTEKVAALVHVPNPKIAAFEAIVSNIKSQIGAAEKDVAKRRQELDEAIGVIHDRARIAVAAAVREFDAACSAARQRRQGALERLSAVKVKHSATSLFLKVTRQENQRRRQELESRQAELRVAEQAVVSAQEECQARQGAVSAERDFVAMVRGFLTSIFDEILTSVSDKANSILGAVANTAHVNVRFFTEATNAKGETRQQITTACTVGGFAADLESGNSGGMFSSVDLAVDRALAEVIAERSNCRPGWVFLDEAWEGMDAVTKESCMEVLTKQAEQKLVLVIDHGSETKELFSDFIDVIFENGTSRIRHENEEMLSMPRREADE